LTLEAGALDFQIEQQHAPHGDSSTLVDHQRHRVSIVYLSA
jgi:hypothetical protein